MKNWLVTHESPDFLVKTAFGIMLVSAIFVGPFAINNLIQERYLLGAITLFVTFICALSAYNCYRGRILTHLNLFAVAPSITVGIAFAIHNLGVMGSYWAYLGALSFYFVLPQKLARLVNILFLIVILPVAWNVLETPVFIRFAAVLLGLSIYAVVGISIIYRLLNLLKVQATTDTLTGLNNRVLLENTLEKAIDQFQRDKTPMSLIMLDIDHFKKVNDQLGHAVGDEVLKSVADTLTDLLRRTDKIFRIGGEEFIALLNNTDKAAGLDVAEKLCLEIEKTPHSYGCRVSVSMGFSSLSEDTSWEQWIKQCDDKLYRAKSNGRNQVVG